MSVNVITDHTVQSTVPERRAGVPRVCWGVPILDHVAGEAYPSHMMAFGTMCKVCDVVLCTPLNRLPHDRPRMDIFEFALDLKCSHVLFIDSDMVVPTDAYLKLIAAMQETAAAVVSGHYYRRGPDFVPVWAKEIEGKDEIVHAPAGSGLHEIHMSGLGCALIDLDFVRQHLKEPYFEMGFNGRCSVVLDDVSFFRKVRAAKGLIIGHADVRCGHLGERRLYDDDTVAQYGKWYFEQEQIDRAKAEALALAADTSCVGLVD